MYRWRMVRCAQVEDGKVCTGGDGKVCTGGGGW